MRRSLSASVALVALVGSSALGACSDDDGAPSVMPPPADAGTEAAAEAGAKKKNGEQGCSVPEDCESNICFIGGRQQFCSVACTPESASTACAAPFTGSCNRQGFCKRD